VIERAAARADCAKARDLRRLSRAALWFIFIDHAVDNALAGSRCAISFSDATETFVFISGYANGRLLAGAPKRKGWTIAAAGAAPYGALRRAHHVVRRVHCAIAWISCTPDRQVFMDR
jgi:hypothetical protein